VGSASICSERFFVLSSLLENKVIIPEEALLPNRPFLFFLVFTSGMTTLAAELSASRLLAPYYGTSLLVWANLIGLILIYLTAGYFLGGRWADRRPFSGVLYQITAWAAFLIGLVPFVAQPILQWSVDSFVHGSIGLFMGSLVAVLALLAIPMVLLGTVSPFAIRLAVRDVNSTGQVAGGVYAISTAGSILGTFLPVLVLIPNIGTRRTFLFFSVMLLGLSLLGLIQTSLRLATGYATMLVIIGALVLFGPEGLIKPAPGLVYETESPYHYIQVIRQGDDTWLALNEGTALHSWYNPRELLANGVWDYFLLAPYFAPRRLEAHVNSLAIIGLAGGTVARQYTAIYGPIPIDGVEIDPQVVLVGQHYLAMNIPNLTIAVQDGRTWLAQNDTRYDVVVLDAYRQPYIPFHLATMEFFRDVRNHLTLNGVAAINVGRSPTDYRLVNALAGTMREVFSNVFILDVPGTFNSLVIGTVQRSDLTEYANNISNLTDPRLLTVARRVAGQIREFKEPGPVFTDDRAPVELVTDAIILRYVLGESERWK